MEDILIDRIGSHGEGLSMEGEAVAGGLPGELVRVRREEGGLGLHEVLEASPDRVVPACRHFADCGGCVLQHWAPLAYASWKAGLVRQALERAGLEAEMAPIWVTPPNSRRRVGLHARKRGRSVELGFKRRKSWALVPICECPVTHPAILEALEGLRTLAEPLFSHPKSAPTLHVTSTLSGLDIDISGVERSKSGELTADQRLHIAMTASEAGFARVSVAGEVVYQSRQPCVRFGKAVVALPTGSFLQATEAAERHMVTCVKEGVGDAVRVADLFCGAGAFTFPLAETASVQAMDSASGAVAALKAAIAPTPGLKGTDAGIRDLFRRPMMADEMSRLDAVVFDPPRAGAEAQAREIARSVVPKVVAVSCNAQTFARDARILVDGGYRLDRVMPVDQFLWSAHVEIVAWFSR